MLVVATVPLLGLLLTFLPDHGAAQDEAAQPAAQQESQERPERQRRASRGRLPAYFRQVVTEQQREEIYSIQAKYREQIEALEKQLQEVNAQQDTEIEGVLTAEQLEQVNALREEAQRARRARAEARARNADPQPSEESTDSDGGS
jgi:S-adenosylmethionine:diacylglycerol 3-amino-3-carboxypropyl transferase